MGCFICYYEHRPRLKNYLCHVSDTYAILLITFDNTFDNIFLIQSLSRSLLITDSGIDTHHL